MNSKLKELRLAAGYTQKRLAEDADVNLRMIQHYEQGMKDINRAEARTVLKLADVLRCEVRDLLD